MDYIVSYPSIIYKDEVGYSAMFPDVPEAEGFATSMEDVYADASHDLAMELLDLLYDGEDLPEPGSLDDFNIEAFADRVGVDVSDCYKVVIAVNLKDYDPNIEDHIGCFKDSGLSKALCVGFAVVCVAFASAALFKRFKR